MTDSIMLPACCIARETAAFLLPVLPLLNPSECSSRLRVFTRPLRPYLIAVDDRIHRHTAIGAEVIPTAFN